MIQSVRFSSLNKAIRNYIIHTVHHPIFQRCQIQSRIGSYDISADISYKFVTFPFPVRLIVKEFGLESGLNCMDIAAYRFMGNGNKRDLKVNSRGKRRNK